MAANHLRLLLTGLVLVIAGLYSDTAHADMVLLLGLLLAGTALLLPRLGLQAGQGGTNSHQAAPGPQRELWQRERVRERRVRYWPWEDPDRQDANRR